MNFAGSPLCSRPPLGWKCSRPEGHDGPCAAHPDFGGRHVFSEAQLDRVKRGVMSLEEGEAFTEAVRDLLSESLRYRVAITAALGSDLALTEHYPEWRACRDAVMNDLRRALNG